MKHALLVEDSQVSDFAGAEVSLCQSLPDPTAMRRALDAAWVCHTSSSPSASPVIAAIMLHQLGADEETRLAALLAPGEDDGGLTLEQVRADFGETVAKLVHNVRWMRSFGEAAGLPKLGGSPHRAERVRRMLLTTVEDVRAVLVKLVYQLRRLQLIKGEPKDVCERVAQETLDIYAPLANRLGVATLKWELEDLAFREREPESYKRIAKALEERRADREAYIAAFVARLRSLLEADGFLDCQVFGRPKHIYSIWKKMRRKRVEFEDLFDVRAVRVLVGSVRDCYAVLGLVHNTWTPIPSEFDDYIANPKDNGYQSLHTAVFGDGGRPVEIQVRTSAMDQDAELGVAAHWHYKEGGAFDRRLQESINQLRQLLEGGDEADSEQENEAVANEALRDRVYVFTPNGDVMDLPAGATPLDFAYAVHTEVGHRCRGAKVNGAIVQLNRVLRTGEQVEILTAREPRPSRNWLVRDLGYLSSARAKAKVRAWFNVQDLDQNLSEGRTLIEHELRRLGLRELSLGTLAESMQLESPDAMCLALARGRLSIGQISRSAEQLRRDRRQSTELVPESKPSVPKSTGDSGISVRGVGQLLTRLAPCCNPVPYDSIVGFITRGKGVTVHRTDCSNIINLSAAELPRLVEVEWGQEGSALYSVDLRVEAYERPGLLRDVSSLLTHEGVNIQALQLDVKTEDHVACMAVTVEVSDGAQLARVISRLGQLPNVFDVQREHQ
ncbi:MAG: RelA/SpoT family protein [Granulosicoccaceae bacterium]